MSISNRLDHNPVRQRVLASGNAPSIELRQHVCHRCGKAWWPRRPNKPARCPGCKSPYWDRPRRLKHSIMPLKEPMNQGSLTMALGRKVARTLGRGSERGIETEDRSLAQALHVPRNGPRYLSRARSLSQGSLPFSDLKPSPVFLGSRVLSRACLGVSGGGAYPSRDFCNRDIGPVFLGDEATRPFRTDDRLAGAVLRMSHFPMRVLSEEQGCCLIGWKYS